MAPALLTEPKFLFGDLEEKRESKTSEDLRDVASIAYLLRVLCGICEWFDRMGKMDVVS